MPGLWAGEHGDGEGGGEDWTRVCSEIKTVALRDVPTVGRDGSKACRTRSIRVEEDDRGKHA